MARGRGGRTHSSKAIWIRFSCSSIDFKWRGERPGDTRLDQPERCPTDVQGVRRKTGIQELEIRTNLRTHTSKTLVEGKTGMLGVVGGVLLVLVHARIGIRATPPLDVVAISVRSTDPVIQDNRVESCRACVRCCWQMEVQLPNGARSIAGVLRESLNHGLVLLERRVVGAILVEMGVAASEETHAGRALDGSWTAALAAPACTNARRVRDDISVLSDCEWTTLEVLLALEGLMSLVGGATDIPNGGRGCAA